ncbi:sodium-dependent nutrient amino acid transporter 1-like [Bradysia coprophila]|uniref:sodium-dependent nutrient amino acid transporter 1-like n=1 Tax=Bradysia coprophila TaxID=38358 RepID=UPI00187DB9F6|nr:sodium-dependent nutrient amino acid transporter 1-like [Bradysia coprophila]
MVGETKGPSSNRDVWANDIEFLLSCISLSVGLGNVWRFPFTVLENGGGAFLFPYIIILFVIGKPIYCLEMILGQFSGRNSVDVYDVSPAMRGIGYGQLYATALAISYYASVLALIIKYLVDSFASTLPWSFCKIEYGRDCINSSDLSHLASPTNVSRFKSSAEFYFYKSVLKEKTSIDDGIGYPDIELALYLGVAWVSISLILIKGIRSSGKASYFLAIFPYVVMIILFVRSVTLPGAIEGIKFLFIPKDIFTPQVWSSAVIQVFFSLAICLGTIIMYSSFNKFTHNINRSVNIVTTLDTLTSLLCSVIIFGILGNFAHETGTADIRSTVQGGSGLAFVSYPNAISKFTLWPQFFSILFFFMLLTLGLGSNVGMTLVLVNFIQDKFTKFKHWQIVLPIAVVQFMCGLVYLTPGGQHILNLVDFYGVSFVALVLAVPELITFGWIYGVERLWLDVKFMRNVETGLYYRLTWKIVSPLLMLIILIYQVVQFKPISYNEQKYPANVTVIGWCIFFCGIVQLPFWMLFVLIQKWSSKNTLKANIIQIFRPESSWGPKQPEFKDRYHQYINDVDINYTPCIEVKEYLCRFKNMTNFNH